MGVDREDHRNTMMTEYIANFVPFEYAKSITIPSDYESNSTFAMRSLRSCQILEEIEGDTNLGDAEEGGACGNPVLVSCWTMIDNKYVTKEDWKELCKNGGKDKFARTDGIAIVSTVKRVAAFLENTFHFEEVLEFHHRKIGPVLSPSERPDSYNVYIDGAFEKRLHYSYQREYRFAFFLSVRAPLEKITFYANPTDYIDRIQIGPEMNHNNICELLCRATGDLADLLQRPSGFDSCRL